MQLIKPQLVSKMKTGCGFCLPLLIREVHQWSEQHIQLQRKSLCFTYAFSPMDLYTQILSKRNYFRLLRKGTEGCYSVFEIQHLGIVVIRAVHLF